LAFLLQAIGPPGGPNDPGRFRELHHRLLPVVHYRVARVLAYTAPPGRDARQEVEDLVQIVFTHLYSNDFRVLRTWIPPSAPSAEDAPVRRASLENYVGLIAEREAAGALRGPSSPWRSEPVEADVFEELLEPLPTPEAQCSEEEIVELVLATLMARLRPQGRMMFDLLWVRCLEIPEICAITGLSRGGVDQWVNRIRDKTAEIYDALMYDPEPVNVDETRFREILVKHLLGGDDGGCTPAPPHLSAAQSVGCARRTGRR
jgi:RNA polymerase sigma factor (sigma-70 family)